MPDEIADDLYHRLCAGDPVAPSEFCERYLPRLMSDRRWVLPGIHDEHMIEDAAIEAVLSFIRHPDRYDPAQLEIMSYLRMAARGDLINLLKKETRHADRRAPIDAVELQPPARNDEHDAPDLPGNVSQELLMRRLREALPDPRDHEAVRLMLDGVRETGAYTRVYGLGNLSLEEQRRQVKRHKDRLDKVMKRLGKRFRGGG